MKRQIQEELDKFKERVLYMGSLVEEMIRLAAQTFIDRNEAVAQQVFEREEKVNRLQMENDETAVTILALYQPEAGDLRTIIAMVKINAELERVADQAVNITQTSIHHLLKEMPAESLLETPRMAEIAVEMIRVALDALAKGDVEQAQAVLKMDEEEDTLKARALNETIGMVAKDPKCAKQLINLILIAKNLEKIGDHATNIAEDVIFMVIGKDIRHHLSA